MNSNHRTKCHVSLFIIFDVTIIWCCYCEWRKKNKTFRNLLTVDIVECPQCLEHLNEPKKCHSCYSRHEISIDNKPQTPGRKTCIILQFRVKYYLEWVYIGAVKHGSAYVAMPTSARLHVRTISASHKGTCRGCFCLRLGGYKNKKVKAIKWLCLVSEGSVPYIEYWIWSPVASSPTGTLPSAIQIHLFRSGIPQSLF